MNDDERTTVESRGTIGIVSGLPRSGTSMIMQMLDAAGLPVLTDGLRPPDSDNPRGYYEFEPVKALKTDASFLEAAVGRVVKVVAPLLPSLPPAYDYRIVFVERVRVCFVSHADTVISPERTARSILRFLAGDSDPSKRIATGGAVEDDEDRIVARMTSAFEDSLYRRRGARSI